MSSAATSEATSSADASTSSEGPATQATSGQASQQSEVVHQLELLRQQEADAESWQEAQEEDQAQRAAAASAAMSTVSNANQVMAYGSEEVADALSQAASNLSGPAQSYVRLAQVALENEDLYTARQCLQSALIIGSVNPASAPAVPAPQGP
jgi:hypothetical protein